MKDVRFNISLYIIIPVIFAGITLLSIIVSYNITHLYIKKGMNPEWPLIVFGIAAFVATFVCGLVIAKMLLGPVERFILKTEHLGVLKSIEAKEGEKAATRDDIGRFSFVFDQVTEILSGVESLELLALAHCALVSVGVPGS